MGSISEELATSNNELVARCDRCLELDISCEYKISPDQKYKPLGCDNCTKEHNFCVFSYPIIGKPPLLLSDNCTECRRAHCRCVFEKSSDGSCKRCKKTGSLCVFVPMKQGRRFDLKK